MAAIDILNLILNETPHIIAFPGSCKRVRFRKNNCQRCVDICPEKVISLNSGPTINHSCSDCGLCQNVCSTEVFQNELCTDQYLLNQAQSFLDQDKSSGGKKTVTFYCHQAENEYEHSLFIPCLGRITENIILGVALSGFDEVILIKGICSQCRLKQGDGLLTNALLVAHGLLEGSGLEKFSVGVKEKGKKKERILGRREIFSQISDQVKNKATSFLYHREKDFQRRLAGNLQNEDGKRVSPRRRLLEKLLGQKDWQKAMVLRYRPEFPWGNIKIDEKICSICGTCLVLCPTGAISKKLEEGSQTFYFKSSLCTNCSLCKEACPQKAIDFEEDFALAGLLEGDAKIVATVELTSCLGCGEIIPAGRGKLCPTCRKRQGWPTQGTLKEEKSANREEGFDAHL